MTKAQIFQNCQVPNGLQVALFFVSVLLLRENMTGLRENLKHKIRALLIWFFLELFRDNNDNPKDAKLDELLSLLSVLLNCF